MPTPWLEYFSGGVPSLDYFLLQVKDLKKLADKSDVTDGIDITAELCLIGLAAYFEAFCKNEFAAVINICPETLNRFTGKRECKLPAKNLLHVISECHNRLGFLVAEEYDFGSARSINALFHDLLQISPFSKKEAAKYGDFLKDRNLLVHHGGIFTARYKGQQFQRKQIDASIYFDSLVIRKKDFHQWANFISSQASKIGSAVSTALSAFVTSEKIECFDEENQAIEALGPMISKKKRGL